MKIRHANKPTLILLAGGLALWLGATGCATKGFVRDEMAAMRQDVSDAEARLGADITAVSNSTAEAMARADLALGGAGNARALALGNAGFEEVEQYTVHFDFDSFELGSEAIEVLRDAALLIQAHPEFLVDVYGFTDASGDKSYNYSLGMKRAESVVRYLAEQTPGQLSRYAAVSYGEDRVMGDNSMSRRVMISLVARVEVSEDVSQAIAN